MASKAVLLLLLVLVVVAAAVAALPTANAQQPPQSPVANAKAVVVAGNARFTVLSEQLVRMEYSPTQQWLDEATLTIVNRYTATVPEFSTSQSDGILIIKTPSLLLTYDTQAGAFGPGSVNVTYAMGDSGGSSGRWTPESAATPGTAADNLLGTVRTLDYTLGPITLNCTQQDATDPTQYCAWGVVSQSGWAVVDDSQRALLAANGNSSFQPAYARWPAARPAWAPAQDWYLFAHGLQYRRAVADFAMVAGAAPLPRRSAFGVFWSRYWAYSDADFRGIVGQYEAMALPLDTVVADMDWHITKYVEAAAGEKDQAGQPPGWTGYTWSAQLFPYPAAFLRWLAARGLEVTVNLHPASGIQPWEERYAAMAAAAGIDPATQRYVPMNSTSQQYATSLMDLVLQPLQRQGVAYFWIDYQQWQNSSEAGVSQAFQNNLLHFDDFARVASPLRPQIMSRYGGLGAHRYPIGFSGDVYPTWPALAFQPYFTATAANVLFGMWSHDIGGHMTAVPPALFTRWMQFGAFSPTLRPHCSNKGAGNTRSLWDFGLPYRDVMRDYARLRSSLVPYIYNASRIDAFGAGVALCHPLYYDYPEAAAAYPQFYNVTPPGQGAEDMLWTPPYLFGDRILVHPVTFPMDDSLQLAMMPVTWLPPNDAGWVDMVAAQHFASDAAGSAGILLQNRSYDIAEMPLFLKAKSVLPQLFAQPLLGSAANPEPNWQLSLYPAAAASSASEPVFFSQMLYDDDGISADYTSPSQYAMTPLAVAIDAAGTQVTVTVGPVQGGYATMPRRRNYRIVLLGVLPPAEVAIVGGDTVPFAANFSQSYGPASYVPIYYDDASGADDSTLLAYHLQTQWSYDGRRLAAVISLPAVSVDATLEVTAVFAAPLNASQTLGGYVRAVARAEQVKQQLDVQFRNGVFQEQYPAVVQLAEMPDVISEQPQLAAQSLAAVPGLVAAAVAQVAALHAAANATASAAFLSTIW